VRTAFPTTKIAPAACHLPRLHDDDSATRKDLGGGAWGPGPARSSGALGASMQREDAVLVDGVEEAVNEPCSLLR
jgi:hypothetical protein